MGRKELMPSILSSLQMTKIRLKELTEGVGFRCNDAVTGNWLRRAMLNTPLVALSEGDGTELAICGRSEESCLNDHRSTSSDLL